jgi:hypothetical protein
MLPAVAIKPEHIFSIPGDPTIADAIFSLDGSAVYILTYYDTLDIGEVLDVTLPAWLGVICLIFVIIGVVKVIAAIRRPREASKRYCPSCNYCVNHESGTMTTCAECGCDLARNKPVLGSSSRRRAGIAIARLIVPAIGVFVLALILSQTVGIFQHLGVRSTRLAKLLENFDQSTQWWWLGGGLSQSLMRADLQTGHITRITELEGATFRGISIHPVTGNVYVEGHDAMICAVDPRMGTVTSRLEIEESQPSDDSILTLDHTDDSAAAFVQWTPWGPGRDTTTLGLWPLDAQTAKPLVTIKADESAPTNTWARRFITFGDDVNRSVYAIPSFSEIYNGGKYLVHVYNKTEQGILVKSHVVDLGPNVDAMSKPLVSLRDGVFITMRKYSTAIDAYSLKALSNGTAEIVWSINLTDSARDSFALSPDERFLYVATSGGLAELDLTIHGTSRVLLSDRRTGTIAASATHVLTESTRQVGPFDAQGNPKRYTADIIVWRVR